MKLANQANKELAAKLRRLRIERGLTTRDLAKRTGLSQSKISRMETGRAILKPGDVYTWLARLNVDEKLTNKLVSDAREIRLLRFGERLSPASAAISPMLIAEMENESSETRMMRDDVIPIYLQSIAYLEMTYVLNPPESAISMREYLEVKLHRQATAVSGRRHIQILLGESVLWRPSLSYVKWVEQLHHISDYLRISKIELGILPLGSSSEISVGSWQTFDKDVVHYEVPHAPDLLLNDSARIQSHDVQFEQFAKAAMWGSEAIKLVDDIAHRINTVDLVRNEVSIHHS